MKSDTKKFLYVKKNWCKKCGFCIEDYVILGAGSLVPPKKKLESGYLYVGSPAKQVRALKDSEKEFLEYSYQHYIKLKDEYLIEN